MMGEGNRLEHNKRNVSEERGKERKDNSKNRTLKKAGVLVGGLLLVGTMAKCGSNNGNSTDTSTDDSVNDAPCNPVEKSRANLKVVPGMGYDTEYDRRRCTEDEGCKMGVNIGDEIAVVNPSGMEEKWVVESVDNDLVVLKDLLTDRTMEIERGGSTFIDRTVDPETGEVIQTNHFMEVYLLGACSIGTVCEEGVSTDVDNATGRAIVALTAGEETKRVMLSDDEGTTVSIGGYTVHLTMAKVTDGHFNIVYSVEGSDEKSELGEPVVEGEEHAVNDTLNIRNESSEDSATITCANSVKVTLRIIDEDVVDEETGLPIEYERELEEGDMLEIGGKNYEIKILAKLTGQRPYELVDWNKSGVEFVDANTGERTVKYKNQTLSVGEGKIIEVGEIYVYTPPQY